MPDIPTRTPIDSRIPLPTPSSVHTITGVPTSVTAFIDGFQLGPVGKAVLVSSWADFTNVFGGLDEGSEASYGVSYFFQNGGTQAWIVRSAPAAMPGTAAQAAGTPGTASGTPDVAALVASLDALTSIDFNLLCIPTTFTLSNADASAVISAATAYCENRHAFYIIDAPSSLGSVQAVTDWTNQNAYPRSRNSALYWPAIQLPDPLEPSARRSTAPSGAIAGVYARTDMQHGVWKSPGGIGATLVGVSAIGCALNDAETAILNPLAINALRAFPANGVVVWGARTTRGTDALGDEYKYVPTSRFGLYLESSIQRGLGWTVFAPNNATLWTQIQQSVDAFMRGIFLQGALQGTKASEAYFVKVDATTTTQADLASGRVNIVVGFAPTRPAEFIVIQIQQFAQKSPP